MAREAMTKVHHSAICARDIDWSLRFWCDGLGFEVLFDHEFPGDWPTLFSVSSTSLRSVFLGDPEAPDAGIVELVDFHEQFHPPPTTSPTRGFLLLSVFTDVEAALTRLRELRFGGDSRQIHASGVRMAVVRDPDGVLVELIDTGAADNLDRLTQAERGTDHATTRDQT